MIREQKINKITRYLQAILNRRLSDNTFNLSYYFVDTSSTHLYKTSINMNKLGELDDSSLDLREHIDKLWDN